MGWEEEEGLKKQIHLTDSYQGPQSVFSSHTDPNNFKTNMSGLKREQITWRMFVVFNKEMGAFYKATGTQNTEVISEKKIQLLEFYTLKLALRVVIQSKICFMYGWESKVFSPPFPKTTQMIVQHKYPCQKADKCCLCFIFANLE